MIRLSIIVPFYNVEQYIEQCIRSLYDQDIPQEEYEVICVDDCSPDESRAVVKRLQKEYPTLRLITHAENKRLGGARNTGLKEVKGQYIWYVDSDDYVVSNCFGELLEIAENNELDILHFEYMEDREGKKTRYYPRRAESEIMRGGDLFFSGDGDWHIHYVVAWQKLYRREFLIKNDIWFQEQVMFEDNEYALRAFAAAKRVKHIDVIAYIYRNNNNSVTRGAMKAQHLIWLLDTSLSIAALIKGFTDDVRFAEAAQKYVQDTVYKIIWLLPQMPKDEQHAVRSYFTFKKYLRICPCLSRKKRYEVFTAFYVRR